MLCSRCGRSCDTAAYYCSACGNCVVPPPRKAYHPLRSAALLLGSFFLADCVLMTGVSILIGNDPRDPQPSEASLSLPNHSTLPTYIAIDANWTSVIVHEKTDAMQLIALAKSLHRQNPEMRYNLFDSTSKPAAIGRFERHAMTDRDEFWDEDWVTTHHLGMINLFGISRTERHWQLTPGMSGQVPLGDTIDLD